MTAADLREVLARHWPAGTYLSIPEAPPNAMRQGRTLDLLVTSLWSSRGFEREGVEIKVSVSDWRRELADVAKAHWWWERSASTASGWRCRPRSHSTPVRPDGPRRPHHLPQGTRQLAGLAVADDRSASANSGKSWTVRVVSENSAIGSGLQAGHRRRLRSAAPHDVAGIEGGTMTNEASDESADQERDAAGTEGHGGAKGVEAADGGLGPHQVWTFDVDGVTYQHDEPRITGGEIMALAGVHPSRFCCSTSRTGSRRRSTLMTSCGPSPPPSDVPAGVWGADFGG